MTDYWVQTQAQKLSNLPSSPCLRVAAFRGKYGRSDAADGRGQERKRDPVSFPYSLRARMRMDSCPRRYPEAIKNERFGSVFSGKILPDHSYEKCDTSISVRLKRLGDLVHPCEFPGGVTVPGQVAREPERPQQIKSGSQVGIFEYSG